MAHALPLPGHLVVPVIGVLSVAPQRLQSYAPPDYLFPDVVGSGTENATLRNLLNGPPLRNNINDGVPAVMMMGQTAISRRRALKADIKEEEPTSAVNVAPSQNAAATPCRWPVSVWQEAAQIFLSDLGTVAAADSGGGESSFSGSHVALTADVHSLLQQAVGPGGPLRSLAMEGAAMAFVRSNGLSAARDWNDNSHAAQLLTSSGSDACATLIIQELLVTWRRATAAIHGTAAAPGDGESSKLLIGGDDDSFHGAASTTLTATQMKQLLFSPHFLHFLAWQRLRAINSADEAASAVLRAARRSARGKRARLTTGEDDERLKPSQNPYDMFEQGSVALSTDEVDGIREQSEMFCRLGSLLGRPWRRQQHKGIQTSLQLSTSVLSGFNLSLPFANVNTADIGRRRELFQVVKRVPVAAEVAATQLATSLLIRLDADGHAPQLATLSLPSRGDAHDGVSLPVLHLGGGWLKRRLWAAMDNTAATTVAASCDRRGEESTPDSVAAASSVCTVVDVAAGAAVFVPLQEGLIGAWALQKHAFSLLPALPSGGSGGGAATWSIANYSVWPLMLSKLRVSDGTDRLVSRLSDVVGFAPSALVVDDHLRRSCLVLPGGVRLSLWTPRGMAESNHGPTAAHT